MDSDRIKKKAEELADRLKKTDSEIKGKAGQLADRLKNKAGETSGSKSSQSSAAREQGGSKARESSESSKNVGRDIPSGRPAREQPREERDVDDLDIDIEEEAA